MSADMLDDADAAQALYIQNAMANKKKVPEKTGFCLACGEEVEGAFCDAGCREDYEKLEKMRKISGKKVDSV
jgi:hypothetical protein